MPSYYGDTALAGLRQLAQVRLNSQDTDLSGASLVAAAQGCAIVVAYRQTRLDAAVLAGLPDLAAIVRCEVDIRTIDVPAASRHGILHQAQETVTQCADILHGRVPQGAVNVADAAH